MQSDHVFRLTNHNLINISGNGRDDDLQYAVLLTTIYCIFPLTEGVHLSGNLVGNDQHRLRRPMKKKSGLMDPMDDRAHRFFALAALFSGDFSIDWLEHMFGGKTSEIILLLEDGVRRGWL